MMISEEELKECIQSVSEPPPKADEPIVHLYPNQCDQNLLKEIVKQSVKNPKWRVHREIKYVLDRIKMNKKIEEGNIRLQRVLERMKES